MIGDIAGLGSGLGVNEVTATFEMPSADGVELSFDHETSEVVDLTAEPLQDSHESNLAEFLPDSVLAVIASDLLQDIRNDEMSRERWNKAYTDGLAYLGVENEDRTQPFKGACGVHSTIIMEATVRFQSRIVKQTLKESGYATTHVVGKESRDVLEKADRVKEYFNYVLKEEMPEYRSEHEKLMFQLAFCGSGFKKLYYDHTKQRPVVQFVPAEDMILPYGFTSFEVAPRYTHRLPLQSKNEILRQQAAGVYRKVDLSTSFNIGSSVSDRVDRSALATNPQMQDDLYNLWECHCELQIPGYEDPTGVALPYVVTIDSVNSTVLAIYRNWEKEDPLKRKLLHFANYSYIPFRGPYGYGLIHLIGSVAKGATGLIRQIFDGGTFANLPGGFKQRGVKASKGSELTIAPGEYVDLDTAGAQDIRQVLFPLPFKEPSGVSLALWEKLTEEGRRLGQISDIDIGEMGSQAPVGTILALMEQSQELRSAIEARVHDAMKQEFKILRRILQANAPLEYPYDPSTAHRAAIRSDFDNQVNIIPVSNPNASTMAQRVVTTQAALQIAAQNPQLCNMPVLAREALEALGLKNVDKIVPDKDDVKPSDPISENMALMNGRPVKAFEFQDHDAHFAAHDALRNDPKVAAFIGQNPQGQSILAAVWAHQMEHLAFKYRQEVEQKLGVQLPPLGEPLPPEIEMVMSGMLTQAADQVLQKHKNEAAKQQEEAMAKDPMFQMEQARLKLEVDKAQQAAATQQAKLSLEKYKADEAQKTERERIARQSASSDATLAVKQQENLVEAELWKEELRQTSEELRSQVALQQAEIAKIIEEIRQMRTAPRGMVQ